MSGTRLQYLFISIIFIAAFAKIPNCICKNPQTIYLMSQLQISLFQYIKTVVPANLSLVDEVADVLGVSNDSAYRRIRGEKEISFEEIQKLSNRVKISIDQVLNL